MATESQKILVICGSKQTGKTTIGNFVTGFLLRQNGLVDNFGISKEGDLIVPAEWKDENGNTKIGEGILNLYSREPEHFSYFSNNVWPIVKCYSFAERLKMVINLVFGISLDVLNGSDLQKNYSTSVKWKDLFRFMAPMEIKKLVDQNRKNSFISNRELMQRVGTDIFRHIDPNCWISRAMNDIRVEKPDLAIITDCRFRSEIMFLREKRNKNTKIIYVKPLKNGPRDKHNSETEMLDVSEKNFDLIIDNEDRTIYDTLVKYVYPKLVEWDFVDEYIPVKDEPPVRVANTDTIFKEGDV